jgi:hypothetical protein
VGMILEWTGRGVVSWRSPPSFVCVTVGKGIIGFNNGAQLGYSGVEWESHSTMDALMYALDPGETVLCGDACLDICTCL